MPALWPTELWEYRPQRRSLLDRLGLRRDLSGRLAGRLTDGEAPAVDLQAAIDAQVLGWELDWADEQLRARPSADCAARPAAP